MNTEKETEQTSGREAVVASVLAKSLRLSRLCADPHLGLSTWNMMFQEASDDLHEYLGRWVTGARHE